MFGSKIRKTCILTTVVMIVNSITSAVLPLKDPVDTARNIERMFYQRAFSITTEMILMLIVFGGFLLSIVQYFLTKIAGMAAYNSGKIKKIS